MKKLALLSLVAALSFWLAGCAGSFKDPLKMPDPAPAKIVGVWISDATDTDQPAGSYVVVFEQDDRFAKVVVDKEVFEMTREGEVVEVGLMSYTLTEDNKYFLEREYLWKVGDKEYPLIFKCDAKERPVRPKTDPKSS